jgi:hypothetical protein
MAGQFARRGGSVPPQKIDYDEERLKLWVRSGGRCALCKKYLLEGELTGLPLPVGEGAHMVGRKDSEASPRGKAPLPVAERDLAENLILLCPDDHTESDKKLATGLISIEWLRERKAEHEAWIRQVTGLDPKRTTVVLRLIGDLRGASVELDKVTATAAVVRADARFAQFYLSADNAGIEINLRDMPGEATPNADYWRRCQEKIDVVIDHKLIEAVRAGEVTHLSVFGFARLPLLVYLGSKLTDNYEIEIYQRHRSTDGWVWPETEAATFTMTRPEAVAPEAVLILNVSGTVDPADLPSEARDLPRFTITIDGPAHPDAIASRASLLAYAKEVRDLLASMEEGGKTIRKLRVFGAIPISAAVALGRAHDRHVHPALSLYDRTDGVYSPALEIS